MNLALQDVFLRAYEAGPYHKIIRYEVPPERPLEGDAAAWARELVAKRGRSS